MANLALVFDLVGRDSGASKTFKDVGNAAESAAARTGNAVTRLNGAFEGLKGAAGAFLGAGVVAGFGALYSAAADSAKVGRLTENVIRSTGGAAGITAKQVGDLATALSNKTGVDDEAIQSGENLLLTFTNVRNEAGKGNDVFSQATAVINDMSVALGQDMSSSAIQVGKALNDPIKGVSALQRVGVSFTESQKEQIATLVETGRTMDAQKLILAELTKEFGGAAEAAKTPFDVLKVTVGNLAEQVGSFLIPAVDGFATFMQRDVLPAVSTAGDLFGHVLGPALHIAGDALGFIFNAGKGAVELFESLPAPIQLTIGALAASAALKGPVGSLFKTISDFAETAALKVLYAKDAIAGLGGAGGAAKAGLSGLIGFLGGPWGIALSAAAVGLSLLVQWLGKSNDASEGATQAQQDLAAALRSSRGAIDENVRAAAAKAAQDEGLLSAAQTAGVSLSKVTDAVLGQGNAYNEVITDLIRYRDAHTDLNGERDRETQGVAAAITNLQNLNGTTDKSIASAQQLAEATSTSAEGMTAAGNAALAAGAAAGQAAEDTAQASEDAQKAYEDWITSMSRIETSFVEPLSIYKDQLQQAAQATADATKDSKDSWQDYAKSAKVSLDDFAQTLQDQITAQEDWHKNLVIVAQRAGYDVAAQLQQMGVEGAGLVAQMANSTDAEMQRMAELMRQDAANGGSQAAAELDKQMQVMAAIGAQGASATAQGIATQLGLGINDVAAIAASYGVTLATGLEPILRGLGKPPIVITGTVTRPGVIARNADGGFIVGPGTGRSDSILSFLSNGEFVVNADATARHRPLLEAINSAPRFANGGFATADDVPRPYSTAPYGPLVASPSDGTMSVEYQNTIDWLKANVPTLSGTLAGVQLTGAIQDIVRSVANQFGWGAGAEWNALAWIIQHESGWRPTAQNPTSTAYGLFQFLNGTWASTGIAKTSDPARQALAGMRYIQSRYGDPIGAQRFWAAHGWYDNGGYLMPGLTLAYNGTGKPERVRTAEQEAALGEGNVTVIAQFGTDTIEAHTVRVVRKINDGAQVNARSYR